MWQLAGESMGCQGRENGQGGTWGCLEGESGRGALCAKEGGIGSRELEWRGAWHGDRFSGVGNQLGERILVMRKWKRNFGDRALGVDFVDHY